MTDANLMTVDVTIDGPYLEFARGKASLAFYLDYGGKLADRLAFDFCTADDSWERMTIEELKAWLRGDTARRAAPAPAC